MADENTGTDNAQAPAPAPTETAGAETASGQTTQQDPIAALRAEYDAKIAAAVKQAENAARFAHQQDQRLNQLRMENQRLTQGYSRQDATETETPATTAQPDYTSARLSLMEFKLAHPDWKDRLAEMQEAAQDPAFSERFGADLNSRATFEAAYEVSENRKLRKELESLRAVKDKTTQAREAAKTQAVVSGQGASAPQENITREMMDKMTPEEMLKKFGKDAIYRGFH